MGKVHGKNLSVYVADTKVGDARDCTLNVNQNLIDTFSQGSSNWMSKLPSMRDWSIDVSYLHDESNQFSATEATDLILNATKILVEFTTAENGTNGDTYWWGYAYLQTSSLTAPLDDVVNGSLTFVGDGKLYKSEVFNAPEFMISTAFAPSVVRNEELNNIVESSTTNLIEITAINGNTITVNYLPEAGFKTSIDWFVLSIDSCNVKTVSYFGDYTVYDKVSSFDFVSKEVELVSSSGFTVGDRLSFYSPWVNYEFLPNQETAGILSDDPLVAWRDIYVIPSGAWYDESTERYMLLLNGRGSTGFEVGYAWCDDLSVNNWTIGNSDAPIILQSDDPDFTNRVNANGNPIDLGNGRVTFLLMTTGAASTQDWMFYICEMNKDCTDISFSGPLDIPSGRYVGNLTIYDGKYTILAGVYNVDTALRTYEMYQSDTIDSGYTKTCDVYTTEYDGHDSVWLEGRSDGTLAFVENGSLYAIVMGESRYYISGHKGRFAGLMKYDDEENEWVIVNNFAPELINPNYFNNIAGESYAWAYGHIGNRPSFVKKDGECYFFCSMLASSSTYQVAALKLISNV